MTGGSNGIILIQQDRGSGTYGTYTTTGNQIHDNIIVDRDGLQIQISSGNSHGAIGGFADYNLSGMLNGGNTWSNNQYFMSDGLGRFQWGWYETFAQFQAAAGETGSISQSYPDTSGWLAMATGTIVGSGGVQFISAGDTTSGTTLSGGTQIDVGLAVGTIVSNGGVQYVYAGLATSTTVNSGGTEYTQNGGVASATTGNVRGVQFIPRGSTASGAILSGGLELAAEL